MSKILDGLYLGNWESAKDKDWLKEKNISHICVCAPAVGRFHPGHFQYKIIGMLDLDCFDPYPLLDDAVDFIKKALEEGTGVLVHDFRGDGRAVGCVTAYFMRETGQNYQMSFNSILSKRPEARLSKKWPPVMKRYEQECVQNIEIINKEKLLCEEQKKQNIVMNVHTEYQDTEKVKQAVHESRDLENEEIIIHNKNSRESGIGLTRSTSKGKNNLEYRVNLLQDQKPPSQNKGFENELFAEIEKNKRPLLKERQSQQKWYTPGKTKAEDLELSPDLKVSKSHTIKHLLKRPTGLEQDFRIKRKYLPTWKYNSDIRLQDSLAYQYDQARKSECCYHSREQEMVPLYNPKFIKESSNLDKYNILNNHGVSEDRKKHPNHLEFHLMKEMLKNCSSGQKQQIFRKAYALRMTQKNNLLEGYDNQ